jgi:hypothetical protein
MASRPASASSYGSQAHREKLQRIKDREDLKGLIVQKFIDKYKKPGKRSVIQHQVEALMAQGVLTEANLRALDQRIQQEMASDTQSFAGISVQSGVTKESEVRAPSKAPSVVSYMSGASDFPEEGAAMADEVGSVRSQRSAASSVRMPPNRDEWAAILQYNTQMYRQQEQLRLQKEHEQKETFRKELDRQIAQNRDRSAQEVAEKQAYADTHMQNLATFDARERQRQEVLNLKRAQEKATREQQLKEQRSKKRAEEKKARSDDKKLLKTLKEEDEAAYRLLMAKKQEEMRMAQEILAQNTAWKRAQLDAEEKDRLEELRRQAELNALIDQQEQAKKEEQRKREERQAQFLTQAADGALKSQKNKKVSEEEALLQHYQARNQFDDEQEEVQRQRQREQKQEMRAQLQSQIQAKRQRELLEKQHIREQADMWRRENQCTPHTDHQEMDQMENQRKKATQEEYVSQLKQQIAEKTASKESRAMTAIERALNKPLIKEIIGGLD